MVTVERAITYAETADIVSRFVSREQRACERMAREIVLPANFRIVSHHVERRMQQEAGR
jgi:cytochrome c551/c552